MLPLYTLSRYNSGRNVTITYTTISLSLTLSLIVAVGWCVFNVHRTAAAKRHSERCSLADREQQRWQSIIRQQRVRQQGRKRGATAPSPSSSANGAPYRPCNCPLSISFFLAMSFIFDIAYRKTASSSWEKFSFVSLFSFCRTRKCSCSIQSFLLSLTMMTQSSV